jgi:hypothetical protein
MSITSHKRHCWLSFAEVSHPRTRYDFPIFTCSMPCLRNENSKHRTKVCFDTECLVVFSAFVAKKSDFNKEEVLICGDWKNVVMVAKSLDIADSGFRGDEAENIGGAASSIMCIGKVVERLSFNIISCGPFSSGSDFALQERLEPHVHIHAPFISSSRLPNFPLLHHHPSWFLKIRKLPKL